MDKIQEKISTSSKFVAIVLRVSCAITALLIAFLLVGLAIFAFSNGRLAESLQQAYATVKIDNIMVTPGIPTLMVFFASAIIQLALILVLLLTLNKMFTDISKSHSPFEEKQVLRIKRVALLTLIICILSNAFDFIGGYIVKGVIAPGINLFWIVIAIVIYCLAFIFDYGCKLQTESDETL